MAIVPSKQVGASVATEPLITNVPIALANTEYSHTLNDAVKQVMIRCRTLADLKYCFISGESGTTYMGIPEGTMMEIDKIKLTSKTIYFQSNVASVVVEILELI